MNNLPYHGIPCCLLLTVISDDSYFVITVEISCWLQLLRIRLFSVDLYTFYQDHRWQVNKLDSVLLFVIPFPYFLGDEKRNQLLKNLLAFSKIVLTPETTLSGRNGFDVLRPSWYRIVLVEVANIEPEP